jgi:hypothetical protein
VDDTEPLTQRFVRVLKNRIDQHGKAIRGHRRAVLALPVERHGAVLDGLKTAARAANDLIRPAVTKQVGLAGIFVREGALKIRNAHLMDSVVQGFLP